MKNDLKQKLALLFGKDKKVSVIVMLGVLGMILIFLSGLKSEEKTERVETLSEPSVSYEERLEQRLQSLIENIDGAGETEVMLVFSASQEAVYAKDTDENTDEGEKTQSQKLKSEYIIVETDNGESGLLTKKVYPAVSGVAVVCSGAGDSVIKQRIIETVSALFDINSKNISVVRKAG